VELRDQHVTDGFDAVAQRALRGAPGELLLVPGPVSLNAEVQAELEHPPRPHYGPDWVRVFDETTDRLRAIFRTTGDVVLFFGPGAAGLEAALHTFLHQSDRLLVPSNGVFGERLSRLAEACGVTVIRLPFAPKEPVLPEAVAEAAERAGATALAVVHNETGCGLVNPLEEICSEAGRLGLFTIVDAVSSLGGIPLEVDRWGIDVCVGVGNKCLAAPVGISPISVSRQAWERSGSADLGPKGSFLNLVTWRDARSRPDHHPHPTTMPTSTLHALHTAAGIVLEDPAGFLRRHAATAALAREGLSELGFPLYVEDERYASPVVTAAYALETMNLDDYMGWLASTCRIRIARGIDTGDEPVFRVGHMGLGADPEVAAAYLELTRHYLEERVPA